MHVKETHFLQTPSGGPSLIGTELQSLVRVDPKVTPTILPFPFFLSVCIPLGTVSLGISLMRLPNNLQTRIGVQTYPVHGRHKFTSKRHLGTLSVSLLIEESASVVQVQIVSLSSKDEIKFLIVRSPKAFSTATLDQGQFTLQAINDILHERVTTLHLGSILNQFLALDGLDGQFHTCPPQ